VTVTSFADGDGSGALIGASIARDGETTLPGVVPVFPEVRVMKTITDSISSRKSRCAGYVDDTGTA